MHGSPTESIDPPVSRLGQNEAVSVPSYTFLDFNKTPNGREVRKALRLRSVGSVLEVILNDLCCQCGMDGLLVTFHCTHYLTTADDLS